MNALKVDVACVGKLQNLFGCIEGGADSQAIMTSTSVRSVMEWPMTSTDGQVTLISRDCFMRFSFPGCSATSSIGIQVINLISSSAFT